MRRRVGAVRRQPVGARVWRGASVERGRERGMSERLFVTSSLEVAFE